MVGIVVQLLVFVLLVAFPATSYAAPAITGVSGTVSDGESVTISGSGFGATGPNIRLFDSFEDGTDTSAISTVTNSADVGEWDGAATALTTYSTDYAFSGSQSQKTDCNSAGLAGPRLDWPDLSESWLFISWWQYLPVGVIVPGEDTEGANWKFVWWYDNDGSLSSDYVAVELSDMTPGSGGRVLNINYDAGAPTRAQPVYYKTAAGGSTDLQTLQERGEWLRMTIQAKHSTSVGALIVHEWDGTSTQEIFFAGGDMSSGLVTAHSDDPWNALTMPGYVRGNSASQVYYDDVYVATGDYARARVEIGNASTYAASTNITIITPDSWADGSITATVRQGSFAAEESAYLFVIDSSGVASGGEAVTFGAAAAGAGSGEIEAGSGSISAGSGSFQ